MTPSAAPAADPSGTDRPMCVDLDGTLVRDDTLWLSLLLGLRLASFRTLLAAGELLIGRRSSGKARLAGVVVPDPTILLYRPAVLGWIREAREAGRPIWLVTGANLRVAEAVARHLALFDRVLASDRMVNLTGEEKARRMAAEAAETGYDYAGNARADFPVWSSARQVLAVADTPPQAAAIRRAFPAATIALTESPGAANTLFRLLRVKQWTKNLLILVPLFTAHLWRSQTAWLRAAHSVAAFCLVSSGIYIINDLLDLTDDRGHPNKRRRVVTSGQVGIPGAAGVALAAILGGAWLAVGVTPAFLAVWLLYLALTLLYALFLRQRLLVDIFLLATFFVLRIGGGAAAIEVHLSTWLLSFSAFTFLSLAMLKRYGEIRLMGQEHTEAMPNSRAYRRDDALLFSMAGIACAVAAVVMLALFVDSSWASSIYHHPHFLWLGCPIMLFWLLRLWLLAQRGINVDDPISFALTDPMSYAAAAGLAVGFMLSL